MKKKNWDYKKLYKIEKQKAEKYQGEVING
jgi:hypothetical protein